MNKLRIGLIGFGTVGQGVAKWLTKRHAFLSSMHAVNTELICVCDRKIDKKDTKFLKEVKLTKSIDEVVNHPDIDLVIELIGGLNPALSIAQQSLKNGKNLVTANKDLIANKGIELFQLASKHKRHILFESSVGAGIPMIKTISEGIAGNRFEGIYGIINGTCNFILDEMTNKNCTFEVALQQAQKMGYAESDPTLDINGMDSTHKLAILVYQGFRKLLKVSEIYTEGISHISHDDIEYAENMNLTIKLLAIAKRSENEIEARVHPTLISKDHQLANVYGIYNAVLLDTKPMGHIMLSGEGAGQMAAASGVISDIINCASLNNQNPFPCNAVVQDKKLKYKGIDDIKTKFYLRFMASDKPGVMAQITQILGAHGIGINSVSQKAHQKTSTVPVIMLTDYSTEKVLRKALDEIHDLPVIKKKPVAIRMEKLW